MVSFSKSMDAFQFDRRTKRRVFLQLLANARERGAIAIVVIEDTQYNPATIASSPEEDVTRLLIERVHMILGSSGSDGLVITDRPGGDRADEDQFLGSCLETLQSGTAYVKPERIVLNVLSTPSHLIRLIQLADVITSCSLAYISGEGSYSPQIFNAGIKPILNKDKGRIGGVGLKIHPDSVYTNLYHWLLGDSHFIRFGGGFPLPLQTRPYSTGPFDR